jgi:hypothetical protein
VELVVEFHDFPMPLFKHLPSFPGYVRIAGSAEDAKREVWGRSFLDGVNRGEHLWEIFLRDFVVEHVSP